MLYYSVPLWQATSVMWDMGIPLTVNLKFVPGRAPCVPELKEEMAVCSRSVFGVEPCQMSFLFFLMYAAAAGGLVPLLESTSAGAQEFKIKVRYFGSLREVMVFVLEVFLHPHFVQFLPKCWHSKKNKLLRKAALSSFSSVLSHWVLASLLPLAKSC